MQTLLNRIGNAMRCCLHGVVERPVVVSDFWESRFDELAQYNADVSSGLLHTPEKKRRMEQMQAEYNDKLHRMPNTEVRRDAV